MTTSASPAASSRELIVGIDLGTTFSAIAYIDEEGRATLINVEGQPTLASVVLYDDTGVVVGEPAMRQSIIKSEQTVRWIKRSMGENYTRTINGKEYTPEEISSEILKKLVTEAQAELGQTIKKAIITCPAWFEDLARKATSKAGELAGLQVLKIVNEPTAAAVYYGLEKLNDGEHVLVYDLGGGTFDCSILKYKDGELDHLMSVGDRKLGGHDWTEILVEKVGERFADLFGEDPTLDPLVRQQLYEQCERAKRELARMPQQTIPLVFNGRGADVVVTQAEFEEWTEGKVSESLYRTEEAVNKAGLSWGDIHHVLLVGGSTRLRRVPEAVAKLAGKAPIQTGKEDTMVALGAAMLSAKEVRVGRGKRSMLRPVKIKERTHRALGMVTLGRSGEAKFKNHILIPAQTPLPAEKSDSSLKTAVANQEHFDVAVLQGDDPDATQNQVNQTYRFKCLPGTPKGSSIGVAFGYDLSNQIAVSAKDGRSGQKLDCQPIEFQWPQGGGKRHVDIGFVVDCTGSMAGCISGVKQQIGDFCSELTSSDFDYRLSLVEYRDLVYGEATRTYDWTTDVAKFREWVSALRATGGGDEPESALDGLISGMELKPRPDTPHVLVLITDATAHVPDHSGRSAETVAGTLKERGIKVFAISPSFPAYEKIVEQTGGKLFNFNPMFTVGRVDVGLFREVLRDLGQAVIDTLLTTD